MELIENNTKRDVIGFFSPNEIKFNVDDIEHLIVRNGDVVEYFKSGEVTTKITFKENETTKFIYEIKDIKNKISGELHLLSLHWDEDDFLVSFVTRVDGNETHSKIIIRK